MRLGLLSYNGTEIPAFRKKSFTGGVQFTDLGQTLGELPQIDNPATPAVASLRGAKRCGNPRPQGWYSGMVRRGPRPRDDEKEVLLQLRHPC